MSCFTIYDDEGVSFSAVLDSGVPIIKHDSDFPVFPFEVKVISSESHVFWLLSGGFHRVDDPAIEYSYGGEHWYLNGKRHRLDGPAVIFGTYKEWWVDDVWCNENDYSVRVKNFLANEVMV